jgi:uncharacterized membrane protein
MRQFLVSGLLWFSAIGCGMVAGLYFAFSTFIMTSFARIAPASGMAAMNAINVEIVRSLFMPVFLGTTLASAILIVLAFFRFGEPGTLVMLAGALIYVLGMFAVTMIFNVPLNDGLAAANPSSADGVSLWARYLNDWTCWNHVRTLASLAAAVLFTVAIAAN